MAITAAGGIPPLVALVSLSGCPPDICSRQPAQLEGAAWALGNIGSGHSHNAVAIEARGGISALATTLCCLLSAPIRAEMRERIAGSIARALGDLAWGNEVAQLAIREAGAVALLQNIACHCGSERTRSEARGALAELDVTA